MSEEQKPSLAIHIMELADEYDKEIDALRTIIQGMANENQRLQQRIQELEGGE